MRCWVRTLAVRTFACTGTFFVLVLPMLCLCAFVSGGLNLLVRSTVRCLPQYTKYLDAEAALFAGDTRRDYSRCTNPGNRGICLSNPRD
ncbi:hypothetical protein B484DRAFT_110137 [Ochromonadaceae sp. CCMP2298]|nr:hypothetical protein B484DRAFT_110137 [Ochromonadaceae sp. CCMP2298]